MNALIMPPLFSQQGAKRTPAVRLDRGPILDEYRVTGGPGETFYVTTTIRAYNAAAMRIRYYSIQPGRLSRTADRSTDDGQTWAKNFQQIEAHRIGTSRSPGPLAPAKNAEGKP